MNAAASRPDRLLIAIATAIGLLVVAALAVVLFRGQPELLDESTPTGVVQRYSSAVIDRDTALANSFLTDAARQRCTEYVGVPTVSRIVLVSDTERSGSATVTVSIVSSAGDSGPFGPSEYSVEGTFSLVKVNGRWLLDTVPAQLMDCAGTRVRP
ncbi:hypothetical protein [Arthrobacter silvisoli]|uniref:hypothetical protein n=1 Tax=Arthrobacter silvisoli TaxID=2291022 RepID=UPI000E216962|nr:hypothetical protein [Arthrobacter silvisoli]